MKTEEKAGESEFQSAVADQASNAKPLFSGTAQEQTATDPILRFFRYEHLPTHLREISMPFALMASNIVASVERSAERSAGLRKLLECKDCIVRAAMPAE